MAVTTKTTLIMLVATAKEALNFTLFLKIKKELILKYGRDKGREKAKIKSNDSNEGLFSHEAKKDPLSATKAKPIKPKKNAAKILLETTLLVLSSLLRYTYII